MPIVLNGTTGITNDSGYIGDGVSFADSTPANTLVTTSGGNVGVGTSSPAQKLQVSGSGDTRIRIDSTDANPARLQFITAHVSPNNNNWMIDVGNGGTRNMRFVDNLAGERARIDSSGNLLVGDTSHTDGSMFQSSVTALNAYRTTTSAGNGIFGLYSDIGGTKTVRAYFKADGGLANYSANDVNLSDERLKKDIALAGGYLSKICAIPVKNFRYKDQSETEDVTLGVIAQDVLAVAPELVSQEGFGLGDKENFLSVYQTDLQYALMKCIQEQQALINAQQAALESLTARVVALEGQAT